MWSEGSSVVSGSALVVRFCRVWSVCVLALLSVGSTAPLERVTRGSFVDCSNSLSYLFRAFERKWGEEGYVVSLPVGGKGRPMRPERTLAWGMQARSVGLGGRPPNDAAFPGPQRKKRSDTTIGLLHRPGQNRARPAPWHPGKVLRAGPPAPPPWRPDSGGSARRAGATRVTGKDRERPGEGQGNTLSRDTLSPSWAPRSSSLRRHQHFVSTRRAHGSS